MEDFENLDLPFYKVRVLYKNGDCSEFLTNDYLRAAKRYHRFTSFGFIAKSDCVYSVSFFNGKTGKTHFMRLI